jgi:hypothetical protein
MGALGTALLLGVVTEGNHSQLEHNLVLAVQVVAGLCYLAALTKRARTRRRDHR